MATNEELMTERKLLDEALIRRDEVASSLATYQDGVSNDIAFRKIQAERKAVERQTLAIIASADGEPLTDEAPQSMPSSPPPSPPSNEQLLLGATSTDPTTLPEGNV